MVRIRTLTLAEWFSAFQLRYASQRFTHLPGTIDVDVTALVRAAEAGGHRFSPTAALAKAAALLMRDKPHLNRMLFHTFFGKRIAEFDEIRVNLPVMIANNGTPVLSAMVFEDALNKSVPELHAEIRTFSKKDLNELPITRFATTRGNFFWNRLALRIIHMMVNRFPRLYATKGGGVSVTSLIGRNLPGAILRGSPLGQTSFTFSVNSFHPQADGTYLLSVGIDYNHSVLGGDEASDACFHIAKLLSQPDLESFYPTTRVED